MIPEGLHRASPQAFLQWGATLPATAGVAYASGRWLLRADAPVHDPDARDRLTAVAAAMRLWTGGDDGTGAPPAAWRPAAPGMLRTWGAEAGLSVADGGDAVAIPLPGVAGGRAHFDAPRGVLCVEQPTGKGGECGDAVATLAAAAAAHTLGPRPRLTEASLIWEVVVPDTLDARGLRLLVGALAHVRARLDGPVRALADPSLARLYTRLRAPTTSQRRMTAS